MSGASLGLRWANSNGASAHVQDPTSRGGRRRHFFFPTTEGCSASCVAHAKAGIPRRTYCGVGPAQSIDREARTGNFTSRWEGEKPDAAMRHLVAEAAPVFLFISVSATLSSPGRGRMGRRSVGRAIGLTPGARRCCSKDYLCAAGLSTGSRVKPLMAARFDQRPRGGTTRPASEAIPQTIPESSAT